MAILCFWPPEILLPLFSRIWLYLSSLLVFIAYLFFGREGFILLLSLAFFVHIVISVSERQQSMIDPQKKTNDLESKAEGKEQSK